MLGGFQDYLINKGWKRYTKTRGGSKIENYSDNFLSGYGPATHFFSHDDHSSLELWYGLAERGKPPCFSLYPIQIKIVSAVHKTIEDAYRIILSEVSYDIIYDSLINHDKTFELFFQEDKCNINIYENQTC